MKSYLLAGFVVMSIMACSSPEDQLHGHWLYRPWPFHEDSFSDIIFHEDYAILLNGTLVKDSCSYVIMDDSLFLKSHLNNDSLKIPMNVFNTGSMRLKEDQLYVKTDSTLIHNYLCKISLPYVGRSLEVKLPSIYAKVIVQKDRSGSVRLYGDRLMEAKEIPLYVSYHHGSASIELIPDSTVTLGDLSELYAFAHIAGVENIYIAHDRSRLTHYEYTHDTPFIFYQDYKFNSAPLPPPPPKIPHSESREVFLNSGAHKIDVHSLSDSTLILSIKDDHKYLVSFDGSLSISEYIILRQQLNRIMERKQVLVLSVIDINSKDLKVL